SGQLGFDFLGIGEALGNLLATLFQHREDAAVSKLVKEGADYPEADDLGDEVRPIDTKSFCDVRYRITSFGSSEEQEWIHNIELIPGTQGGEGEIRVPKPEGRKKAEIRNPKCTARAFLRTSDLGFRIGICPPTSCVQ